MSQLPNSLRITIQLISIMIFIQWTQGGKGVTQKPSKKEKYHAIMRTVLIAEAFTNCTCPKDTPIDTVREYCGWEILEKTGPSNDCQNHSVYRCMDPDPWKAIDHIPCAHYGDRNSDKTHQRCGLDLAAGHTYLRHCIV
jgi:hypothetical protein